MNVMVKNDVNVRDAFRQEDYSFTIDWLNVRLDCDNLDMLLCRISMLLPEIDISDWEVRESGGVCFYKEALYLPDVGYSSVVLSFNRDLEGNIINKAEKRGTTYGILVSISGDGCRYINSLHDNAFVDLLKVFEPFNPHCSRIDCACDIFDSENQIVPLIQLFSEYAYDRENAPVDFNCNLNRRPGWVTANLVYDDIVNDFTKNVTIGGRNSTKGTLQLYNKRAEILQSGRLTEHSEAILNAMGNPEYWWRLEYRCKSFAQKVYDTLVQSSNIYQTFLCAVEEMGLFVIPYSSVANIAKSDTCVEWVAFLAFINNLIGQKIRIKYNSLVNLPYIGSALSRVQKFHTEQISGNDSINMVLLLLDKEYRDKVWRLTCHNLVFNKKLRPALKELSVKYGLKISDIHDLAWEQSDILNEVS